MRLFPGVCNLALVLGIACGRHSDSAVQGASTGSLQQGVRDMAEQIPRDLAREGPRGWLRHFHRGPAFFMASDGRLVFPSDAVADSEVTLMAASVGSMKLDWQGLRIDSLAPDVASLGTPFTEEIIDLAGQRQEFQGYFTAIAERADSGWQLRNLHWSLIHGAAPR